MQQKEYDFASCEKRLRDLLASGEPDAERSDELWALLDTYMDTAAESDMDATLISACLARLRECHPEKPPYDKEAGLARLIGTMQADHDAKRKRIDRTSRFVSILVAVVSLLVVAAAALGFNPFEYLYRAAETVSFHLTASGEMVLPSDCGNAYTSLQEALTSNGIDIGLPQWIPPAFSIFEVRTRSTEGTTICAAIFRANEKELRIEVTAHPAHAMVTCEKEEGGTAYESAGQTYYIIPNTQNTTVSWEEGGCMIQMYGQITESEAKYMIDSIH